MAYVVLARKYRPLQFADMVGQEHVTRTLSNAIVHGRVHHGYLFAGARGLGKTTTARILAKALVCERGPTPTPCDACHQCLAVQSSTSVDVIEIDGASNNRVDDVRNLREQVHYLPQSARRRIYIIDEVHMLTSSAFNALLKTLEEPPEHVNFMFATTEPHKLLPTILSRVSRLDFRRVSTAHLAEFLQSIATKEGLEIEPGALLLVARAAGGSVRDGLTLLDQVLAFSSDAKISEADARFVLGQADSGSIAGLIDAVLDRDPARALAVFDEIVAAGHDLSVLGNQVLQRLRDLSVLKLAGLQANLIDATDSELQQLRAQADKADAGVLGQLFDRFARVLDLLPQSTAPRITLEMGLLDLVHSEPLQSVGSLIARLEGIGTSGPSSTGGAMPSPGQSRPSGAASRPAAPGGGQSRSAAGQSRPEAEAPSSSSADAQPAATAAVGSGPISGRLWDLAQQRGLVGGGHGTPSPQAETPPTPSRPRAEPAAADPPSGPTSARHDGTPTTGIPTNGASMEPCEPCLPAGSPNEARIPWEELSAFDAWERLITRIRAQGDEVLSAVVVDLGLLALDDGVIRLAAAPRSFSHTRASRPDVRAAIEQAILDHLGAPFEVRLEALEPSLEEAPSLALVEAQRRAQRQAEAEQQAREHGAIRRLLETFDGRLATVKPLD